MAKVRKHIYFSGQVQGVGFRYRATNAARANDLTGWVDNLWDGRVGAAGGVWKWKLSVYAGSPVCSRPVPLFIFDLADDQALS